MKRLLFFLSLLITVSIQAQTYKPVSILPAYTPAVGHVPIYTNTPNNGWQSRPLAVADISGLQLALDDKLSISTPPVFSSLKIGSNIAFPTVLDGAGVGFNPTAMVNASGQAGFAVYVNDGTFNTRLGMFVDHTNGVVGLSQTQAGTSRPFVYRNSNGEAFRVNSNRTWNWPAYNVANGFIMSNGSGDISAQSAATVKGILAYTTSDVTEGTNLYYTDTRARNSFSLTTTGSSGAASYDPGTGVLNIPTYSASGTGDVSGPASSTATAIARFSNTTGKLLDNTGVLIDATNHIITPGNIYSAGGSGTSTYSYRGIYFNPASSTVQLSVENSSNVEGGFFINSTNTGNIGTYSSHALNFLTNNLTRGSISNLGEWRINSLSGTGTRFVVADADGDLSTVAAPTGGDQYVNPTSNFQTAADAVAGTLYDATGFAFPVEAGGKYSFEVYVVYETNATTTGAGFNFTGPTASYFSALVYQTDVSLITFIDNNIRSYGAGTNTTTGALSTGNILNIKGVANVTASGDIQLQVTPEVAGPAWVRLIAGASWIRYKKVN